MGNLLMRTGLDRKESLSVMRTDLDRKESSAHQELFQQLKATPSLPPHHFLPFFTFPPFLLHAQGVDHQKASSHHQGFPS